jgi:excisionase family DNA binding protein
MTDRLLEAAEVAELLGVKVSWVRQETRANRLPHIRLGRWRRYRRESIEAWLEENEVGQFNGKGGS